MRRNLEEVEREVFARRDAFMERKTKRRRAVKRLVPAAGCAALALVFAFAVLPLIREGRFDPTADGEKMPSSDNVGPNSGVADGGNWAATTNDPPQVPTSAEPSDSKYGSGWYCGTPTVNANDLTLEECVSSSRAPCGGLIIARRQPQNLSIPLSPQDAAALFEHLTFLKSGAYPAGEDGPDESGLVIELLFENGDHCTVFRSRGVYTVAERPYTLDPENETALLAFVESIINAYSEGQYR